LRGGLGKERWNYGRPLRTMGEMKEEVETRRGSLHSEANLLGKWQRVD